MKRFLSLALCVLMVLSLVAGCGEPDPTTTQATEHKHTYAKEWSFDETSHWYQADCGHNLQANLADHEDADKNGTCDVCTWSASCDHGFDSAVWQSDENSHWHPATCGVHTGAKSEEAAHKDEDNDGACDVCAYTGGHTHSFSQEWSYSDTEHWYAATCGHDVTDQRSLHSDENLDGVCDVCGWFDASHTHTYDNSWQTNAIYHWHSASCEHTGAKADQGQHLDENGDDRCDVCAMRMCPHEDYNDDGTCDSCGWYDPDHTHTFEQMDYDGRGHWYVASCHSGATSQLESHADKNQDGICDVCTFQICSHVYDEAWTTDETHHWHAVLCSCSIGRKDYAEHTLDADGVCTECMYGYIVEAMYEVVVDNEPYSLTMNKMLDFYEFTVNFPQAGTYVLYPSLDGVKICTSNDGENVPNQSAVTMDVAEAGEMTLYFRHFDYDKWLYSEDKSVAFTYTVVRIEDVVIDDLRGKVELPTNTIYKLVFHAPELGSYNLVTSVNNVVIGLNDIDKMEYYKGQIEFEVTEIGQEFIFYVELRDLQNPSFIFDWFLEAPFSLDIGAEGNYAVNVAPKSIDYKINFTAPEAGYYKLSVSDKLLTFCRWSEDYNQPVRMETTEVLTGYLEKGQVFTTWLQTVYNYEEATNLFDTLNVANVGKMVEVGETTLPASTEGQKYTFQASGTTYYSIYAENGQIGIIANNGSVTWTDYYEVKVTHGYSYSFMVRGEGDENGNIQLHIGTITYAIDLSEGENNVIMTPAKEYDLTFLNNADPNRNIKLTWDNSTQVMVFVNGEAYLQGTEVALLHNTFTVVAMGQTDIDVLFTVEITNPSEGGISGDKDAILVANQMAMLAIANPGDVATATFTAEVGGTYTFYCYTQGVNVYQQYTDGTQSLLFSNENSADGTYTFQVNAGDTVIFAVSAIDPADTMSVMVMVGPK